MLPGLPGCALGLPEGSSTLTVTVIPVVCELLRLVSCWLPIGSSTLTVTLIPVVGQLLRLASC